ncbi:hypothetical protein CTZ27_35465 [Streptomyces griseocarneus]|nr:hypothetical protein CTZ27_35465 [Streptomyces griseocarneus]
MHHIVTAADLTTGAELKNWILTVTGNVFAAFLGIRAVGAFMKDDYGKMATLFLLAVFVGAAVWFPDQVKDLLQAVWRKVVGA